MAQYQNSELGPLLQRLQAYANEGIKLESADVMHLLSLAAYDETGTVKEVDSGVSTLPASWVDAMMHQDAGDEAEMWHRYSYWLVFLCPCVTKVVR